MRLNGGILTCTLYFKNIFLSYNISCAEEILVQVGLHTSIFVKGAAANECIFDFIQAIAALGNLLLAALAL